MDEFVPENGQITVEYNQPEVVIEDLPVMPNTLPVMPNTKTEAQPETLTRVTLQRKVLLILRTQ